MIINNNDTRTHLPRVPTLLQFPWVLRMSPLSQQCGNDTLQTPGFNTLRPFFRDKQRRCLKTDLFVRSFA